MPAGKAASQAGHAFLMSYLNATGLRQYQYHADGGLGTKICLRAPSLIELMEVKAWCDQEGLPCYLVEDTGRNTTFGGVPTVSALGIGPLNQDEAAVLAEFNLY